MIQVRDGVFETNSSSVHSVCISRAEIKNAPSSVHFYFGSYEWSSGSSNAKDYLWTAILLAKSYKYDSGYKNSRYERIKDVEDHIRDVLSKYGVEKVTFEYPKLKKLKRGEKSDPWFRYESEPNIDHDCETREFVDICLNNDDLLARTVLGNSSVYTGNDNSCDSDDMCYCAEPTVMEDIYNESGEWDGSKQIYNPNYDPEHYDYFIKGN